MEPSLSCRGTLGKSNQFREGPPEGTWVSLGMGNEKGVYGNPQVVMVTVLINFPFCFNSAIPLPAEAHLV
jgi:hypothetical protein